MHAFVKSTLNSKYSIKLANHAVIITPIFVFLKIAINCDTTNININIVPIFEKYAPVFSIISLSFLTVLAPIP